MRIEEQIKEELKKHFKNCWPREFAKKFSTGRFMRNERVNDIFELIRLMEWYDCENVYTSVYAFSEWHESSSIRKQSTIINTLVFDLDSENLRESFNEAKKLTSFLMCKKTIPRVYFSGSKGFHVYIDFPEVDLKNFDVLKEVGLKIARKLNLKTVDPMVFEPARVIRIPFSRHGGSGLYCKPINPEKFLEMDYLTMKQFVKHSFSPIEVHESNSFVKLLKYMDFKISTDRTLRSVLRGGIRRKKNGNGWIQRRVEKYLNALKKYGRLTADSKIAERHKGNEHNARLHLNFLLVEAGYSDEEIKEVFSVVEDYNERIIDYQVRYNRKWLERNKAVRS